MDSETEQLGTTLNKENIDSPWEIIKIMNNQCHCTTNEKGISETIDNSKMKRRMVQAKKGEVLTTPEVLKKDLFIYFSNLVICLQDKYLEKSYRLIIKP